MPEQLQTLIEAIKDYGAAIISTLSVGGIAAVAGIIAKVKESIENTKNSMNAVLAKKDEQESKMIEEYEVLMSTIADQNRKIDTLTTEITRIKKD